MQRSELDKVRLGSSSVSSLSDSDDDPESDATEDEGDVAYELDAIKYATWMKSPMDRGGGRIKNVWRWHYGVMWRNYLRSHSDSGDQPSENFDPEENPDDDLVVAYWRAIVNSPNAPPQLHLEPGQREPSDPGKALRYPHIFDCPHAQMQIWLKDTNGKRLFSTYLQRQRWEREHPDEPVPKRLSDHYVYKKRLRDKARAEAAGENGRRFIKGGSIALKPKHKRKIREASSGDSEPERSGSASRSVNKSTQVQADKREEVWSRASSSDPAKARIKDKKAREDGGSRVPSTSLPSVKDVKDGERSRSGSSDARKEEKRKRKAEAELETVKQAKTVERPRDDSRSSIPTVDSGNAIAGPSSRRATPSIDQSTSALSPKASPAPRAVSPIASESSLDSIFNSDHEGASSQPAKKRKKRIESSPVEEIKPTETKEAHIEGLTEKAPLAPTPLFTSSRSPSPINTAAPAKATPGPSFGEPEPGIFDAAAARASAESRTNATPRDPSSAAKKSALIGRTEPVAAPPPRVPVVKAPVVRPPPLGVSTARPLVVRPAPPQYQARPSAQAGLPARPPSFRLEESRSPAGVSKAVRPSIVRPPASIPMKPIPTGPSSTANIIRPAPPSLLDRTMASLHSTVAPARPPVEPPTPVSSMPSAMPSSSYVPRRPSYVQQQSPLAPQPQYFSQPWMQHHPALPSPAMTVSPIVSPHLPASAELYKPAFDPRLRKAPGQASPLGSLDRPSPGEAFPNIFDRRFALTLPFRSKPSSFELSLASSPEVGDIVGAKLLNSLLFWAGDSREVLARPLGSFEPSEACCLHGQIALGAKLRYKAGLNVIESSAGVGGQQLWEDLGGRRGSAKILASFTELMTENHISVHYALIVARADTISADSDDKSGASSTTAKLVFAVYEVPLDSRPPPMLPDPVRPFAPISHARDTPPSSPKAMSVIESYGLSDTTPIPLTDRFVLIYPGRDGPLDALYAAISTFCTEHGLRGAGDGRPAEVALFNNGKMSRVVKSTSIRQNLARRARYVSFGPNMDLYPSQWRATEVWQRGGLVTFSPTFILRSPEKFAAIMGIVRAADSWAAYIVPEVLKWCDDSWKQPARCPEPEKAFDALATSLPFDQHLARLSDNEATTNGGLVVSCCPPVIHDTAGCERWLSWLRKSSSSSTYPDLVDSCRGASSTGFSTSELDAAAQDMALIDVETVQLDDLARMRSRPHLLPYRRYILVGEVSLDRKARDRYEAEIEFVAAEDFTAVISGVSGVKVMLGQAAAAAVSAAAVLAAAAAAAAAAARPQRQG